VSAERLFELARHLTERDREVALYLYRHRVLTTDQLQLLFFSSRRRAQDRLLFLDRNRVLDRFYPPAPFGSGKPEAHWIIGNPTYAGRIRWRDRLFDGVHEPLVDELAFARAQAILRERSEDISPPPR
jgi:hypothetical protein